MYIVDDICYAGDPGEEITEIEIIEATPLKGGVLLLLFSTGEKKLFDTTTLEGSAFLPLREESVFNTAKVEYGFVSWLDGQIDIAPEYMYIHGWVYNESDDVLLAG